MLAPNLNNNHELLINLITSSTQRHLIKLIILNSTKFILSNESQRNFCFWKWAPIPSLEIVCLLMDWVNTTRLAYVSSIITKRKQTGLNLVNCMLSHPLWTKLSTHWHRPLSPIFVSEWLSDIYWLPGGGEGREGVGGELFSSNRYIIHLIHCRIFRVL